MRYCIKYTIGISFWLFATAKFILGIIVGIYVILNQEALKRIDFGYVVEEGISEKLVQYNYNNIVVATISMEIPNLICFSYFAYKGYTLIIFIFVILEFLVECSGWYLGLIVLNMEENYLGEPGGLDMTIVNRIGVYGWFLATPQIMLITFIVLGCCIALVCTKLENNCSCEIGPGFGRFGPFIIYYLIRITLFIGLIIVLGTQEAY